MDSNQIPSITLKPDRERSLLRNHPWIYSGAIDRISEEIESGRTIRVMDAKGHIFGYGAYSPVSQIRVRMWSLGEEFPDVEELIRARVRKAVHTRKAFSASYDSNAYRLIHSESDHLPGVIADQYDGIVVVQLLTAGATYWRDTILDAVHQEAGCECLIERSDADVLALEGLQPTVSIIHGKLPEQTWIKEHALRYRIDPLHGQKTGFYMDQRDNHRLIRQFASRKRVLDCFTYSGAFALNTLAAGADFVEAVDSSAQALELAQDNLIENHLDGQRIKFSCENVFEYLRKLRDRAEAYDLIILDPPKLAPTQAQVDRAARAYKDINLLAMKLLRRNGILVTFSCSGGMGMDFFKKIIADAALDAKKEVQIIHQMHQSSDHPILTSFPESEYLKGLVCQVE